MGIGIHCCKDCVPPKRHAGCHDKCEEYNNEKKVYEEAKAKMKENIAKTPRITKYEYDSIEYARSKRHKRNRHI